MSTLSKQPRRPWWRFFVQFSLRTLLLLTTLAAVGCWWFFQPPTREEEVAGKHLKLRRQVKLVSRDGGPIRQDITGPRDDLVAESAGSWRLFDEHGDSLVIGRCQNDVPQGKWTVYHTNGQKAAEGSVVRGARNGLWRVWDTAGRLQSEVTYVAVEMQRARNRPSSGFGGRCWSVIPVVGMTGPLGQMGGLGGFPIRGGGIFPARGKLGTPPHQLVAERHGQARVWQPNGKLKLEGNYVHDLKDGPWRYYDEQGVVIGQGEFRQDRKEGRWLEQAEGTAAELREVEYVAGRTRAAHERLLSQLQQDVSADASFDRQMIAVERLETLGGHGVPLLLTALAAADDDLQTLAAEALERILARNSGEKSPPIPAGEIVAQVQPLASAANPLLRRPSLLILFRQSPADRERLLLKLLAAIRGSDDPAWQLHAFATIVALDPQRQAAIFEPLAVAASPHVLLQSAGYTGALYWQDPPGFVALAAEFNDLPTLLNAHSQSRDPAVRRFVLAVVNTLTFRGKPERIELPGQPAGMHYCIPQPYRELVERLKTDHDAAVREAAENVGQRQLPSGMGGSMF